MNGEAIFIQLFDVGNSIKINELRSIISGIKDKRIIKTKDTPDFLEFPETLDVEITNDFTAKIKEVNQIIMEMKIFKEGVISISLRYILSDYPLEKLHSIRNIEIQYLDQLFTADQLIYTLFKNTYNQIRKFIDVSLYAYETPDSEKYTIFTINDEIEDPNEYIRQNKQYFATLLLGENPVLKLHPLQIENTLKNPFCFQEKDYYLFDYERCLIIDPTKDYEDIILVIELANYQLLELRTFDRFLDSQLEKAEDDIRSIYFKRKLLGNSIKKKLAYLYKLRYDMIFIWENLENISKIIGDYFLSQIYTHLSNLFNLDEWGKSIRNRRKILDDLYSSAKSDVNERNMLILEVMIVVLFVIDIFVLIGDFFKK